MTPRPVLVVQPTVELAKPFSQQRIGGMLVMTGAHSAVGLRSMPVRYLFLDEVDARMRPLNMLP